MRSLALVLLLCACSHGEEAVRAEQARTRQYRDSYETQAQEIAALKARIADLEKQNCR